MIEVYPSVSLWICFLVFCLFCIGHVQRRSIWGACICTFNVLFPSVCVFFRCCCVFASVGVFFASTKLFAWPSPHGCLACALHPTCLSVHALSLSLSRVAEASAQMQGVSTYFSLSSSSAVLRLRRRELFPKHFRTVQQTSPSPLLHIHKQGPHIPTHARTYIQLKL